MPELPEDVRRAALARMHADSSPWFALGPPQLPVRAAGGFVLHDGWQFAVGTTMSRTPPAPWARAARSRRRCRARCSASTSTRASDVSEGQALVLLEAMKMELAVTAPGAGVVSAVLVEAGELVSRGQALVELDADE